MYSTQGLRFYLLSALLLACSVVYATPPAVGEVSLAVGTSRLHGSNGVVSALRGVPVRVGDRIETGEGGHVHIRFVDGAFVSVRPGSRLLVESYLVDKDLPANNAIKFRLEEGVARSISGRATEAARDRFRLNTPIAAIGVRGTDFVTLAENNRVAVTVNSGEVVLARLGATCAAEAYGPCVNGQSLAYGRDRLGEMLELHRDQNSPRVVPLSGARTPDQVAPSRSEEPKAGTAEAKGDAETKALLNRLASTVPSPADRAKALVWGRWSWTQQLPFDELTVPVAEAREGRHVTVGSNYYALFREGSRPETPLPTSHGEVQFVLRDAQVHYSKAGTVQTGAVNGGWLRIDFGKREFATGLTLHNVMTGQVAFKVAGSVRDDGIFAVNQSDTQLAGAVTFDSKEAGYFFEKSAGGGTFSGVTRWGR